MAELSTAEILERVHTKRLGAREAFEILRGGAAGVSSGDGPAPERPTDAAEPIAVIGMAGRFPGAPDVETLWENLLAGRDSVGTWPADRWDVAGIDDAVRCRAGGFLDDVAGFDPHFFGLSSREAEHIDPQQRLFLMEAWRALENAGHAGPFLDGARVGVFVGCAEGDYADVLKDAGQLHTSYTFMGNASAILASRLSYHLNLTGPALAVDTACSASLVSIHLACESLRRGECEMALAGGTYVMSTPRLYLLATSAGMLSPSGHCHAFGSEADGFVPAEAVGAVVLKPLSRALKDGDRVLAVVEASGINQDGRTNGITAPNGPSQTALECDVYDRFGVDPAGIRYVEAHGTGTALGDPIEVQALADAFAGHTGERGFCRLGSIKANIGHAQLAAGIAGFIKLVLAVERGVVPPTLHAAEPNPHLGLDATPFRLPQAVEDFPAGPDGYRRGAVSGFGFSGTNAHVVVRSHSAPAEASGVSAPVLVLLSGRDPADLADQAGRMVTVLEDDPPLADIALTLLTGRAHHSCRRALVVDDPAALRRGLIRVAERADGAGAPPGDATSASLVDEILERLPRTPEEAGPGARKALDLLAGAYEGGADVGPAWRRALFGARARRLDLPGTRFRLRPYWAGAARSTLASTDRFVIAADDPLREAHVVAGVPTVPGAALLGIAHAAAGSGAALEDVRFQRRLTWPGGGDIVLRASRADGALTLLDAQSEPVLTARIVSPESGSADPAYKPAAGLARGTAPDALYARFADAGLDFGPRLRCLERLAVGNGHVVADAALTEPRVDRTGDATLSAEILDSCCQLVGALAPPDAGLPLFVPASLDRIDVFCPLPDRVRAVMCRCAGGTESGRIVVDLDIFDRVGSLCASLRGLTFVRSYDMTAVVSGRDSGSTPAGTLVLRPRYVADRPAGDPAIGVRAVVASGEWGQALAAAVRPSSGSTGGVLILVSEPPPDGEEAIESAMQRTVLAVRSACAEPLERVAAGETVRLVHVFADDDPWGEALAGYWRGVVAEHPALAVACLALPHDTDAEAAALRDLSALATEGGVSEWRWRDGRLERLTLEPVEDFGMGQEPAADLSGVVVVAGGGALGEALGRDLARRHGTTVALLGRSQKDGEEVMPSGGRLLRLSADVTDPAALASALERTRAQGPISGVVHTAGVAGDSLLAGLTTERVRKVVLPKAGGALLLDRLTRDDPLSFFVVFGALAARAGNPGQAAYGFANRFLSAFAHSRERQRVEGTRSGRTVCLDWPLWRDGAMTLPSRLADSLRRHVGLTPMPYETGRALFEAATGCTEPEIVLAHGDKARLAASLGVRDADATLPDIAPDRSVSGAAPEEDPRARTALRARLAERLCAFVSDVLPVEGVTVSPDADLAEYDFDSIAITGLVDDLNRSFGFKLSPTAFYDAKTLEALAEHLLVRWPDAVAAALGTSPPVARADPADAPAAGSLAVSPAPSRLPEPTTARSAPRATDEPIAIVGFDLRFPGAGDPDAFRRNLLQGVDTAVEIPPLRWDWRSIDGDPSRESGRTNVHTGCFIEDIDRFDAAFFAVSPVEADLLDPQQRLLLETAWRAVERAGHAPGSLAGSRTGVFVGCAGYDYATVIRGAEVPIEAYTATGIAPSLLSNRLSYVLDLAGPSETVDTACSSSLVALDKAVRAIRLGLCESAIVGAASAMLTPDLHIAFARAGMLSPGGRCRSFDAAADGYARGEGVVALYLKPLSRARDDGDPVHAVVLGSAVNHGGHATSLTAPNAAAQADVLRTAWSDAGVVPGDIGHIEAHGTGTRLGDPVEIEGLTRAFAEASRGSDDPSPAPGSISVSTVKAQIGHLEGAAGLAGLVSALFAVRDGVAPGNPQLETLNPLIAVEGTPLAIEAAPRAWSGRGGRRVAGVSSFGFGGTNAHVVIADAPDEPSIEAAADAGGLSRLVVLSARTADDLDRRIADLAAWLDERCLAEAQGSVAAGDAPVDAVRDVVAGLIDVPAAAVPPDEPLAELGLDGTRLHALAGALAARFGRRPSPEVLSVDATVRSIAGDCAPADAIETASLSFPGGRTPTLAEICWTLQVGRDAMAERLAFAVHDLYELRAVLFALVRGEHPSVPVMRGTAGQPRDAWQRLLAGESGRRMLAELARDGQLADIAELWVGGATVDWAALVADPPGRIELPPYRFAGARHWVGGARASQAGPEFDTTTTLPILGFVPAWLELADGRDDGQPALACDFAAPWPDAASGTLVAVAPVGAEVEPAGFLTTLRTRLAEDRDAVRRVVVALTGSDPRTAALAEAAAAFLASWAGEAPWLDAHVLLAPSKEAAHAAGERVAAAAEGMRPGRLFRLGDDGVVRVRTMRAVAESDPGTSDAAGLPDRPVCLVTGASGGLGRLVVRHLARRHGARMVLLSRRIPEDADDLLASVEAAGGAAVVRDGNVCDADAVASALAEARERFGPPDVILHIAGMEASGLVERLDGAAIADALAAKTTGLLTLLDATAGGSPPRIVCFSSLAGWLDVPGQAAYAAANRFMDAFGEREARVTSLAWPAWDGIGMAADAAGVALMRRDYGLGTIAPEAALARLDTALEGPHAVLAFAPVEANSLLPERLTDPCAGAQRTVVKGGESLSGADLVMRALGLATPPDGAAGLEAVGFTSLVAVRLVNEIRVQWDIEMSVTELVGHDRVDALIAALDRRAPGNRQAPAASQAEAPVLPARGTAATDSDGEARDLAGGGAASEGQGLMALHQAVQPDSYAYNMPVLFDLDPAVDAGQVASALAALCARHATLRTRLVREGSAFCRVVDPAGPVALETLSPDSAAGEADLRALARRPFRLAEEWPLRGVYIDGSDEAGAPRRQLLVVIHHTAADGLSLPFLHDDLEALLSGRELEGASTVGYDDFVAWQDDYLRSERAERDRTWWREILSGGGVAALDLPVRPEPPAVRTRNRGAWSERRVDPETRASLAARHTGTGRSLAAILMAGWASVLSRFARDGDLRLLVPTAGHREGGFERLVGLLMNPVPVVCNLDGARRFSDVAGIVARALTDALSHVDWPLAKLIEDLSVGGGRMPGLHEIAQAGFLYRDETGSAERGSLLRLRGDLHHEGDFTLALEAIGTRDGGLRLILKHDPDFVDSQTASLLLDAVSDLFGMLARGEDPALEALSRASARDLERVASWNADTAETAPFVPVEAAIRRRAEAQPDRPAVRDGSGIWDYAALDRYADCVASALRAAGTGVGEVVAVCVPRDAALPATLVGVMRAGAAYLPVDPALPAERIAYMLEDAGVRFAVAGLPVPLPDGVTTVDPDAPAAADEAAVGTEPAAPGNLAYVIYTSGSTGRPKGVEVTHGNLANFVAAMIDEPGIAADDVMLALTTVSFDISGLELFAPLVAGGLLTMVGADEARDGRRLADLLSVPGPTVVQATPSTWRLALAAGWSGGGTVRRILVGGEPMSRDLRDRLVACVPEVWNMYGPTETTIWSTAGTVVAGERVTVGRAIAGTSLHVVDDAGRPLAVGVPGELWIGGAGVAAGYRGRPELTAERFVAHRDEAGTQRRVYRTGDRARWLADGRLEILGRMDHQIKLRGHRIEPGEIEATVVERLGDRECAITLGEGANGQAELVAHVVPGPATASLDEGGRIRRLRTWLPDVMIPVRWIVMDALPLTPAGKLDRAALAEGRPVVEAATPQPPNVQPRGPVGAGESLEGLRALLAEALGRRADELDDDLPMSLLGLDSMMVVALADRVAETMGAPVVPGDFFDHPTLRALAAHVARLRGEAPRPRLAAPVTPAATPRAPGPVTAAAGSIAIIGMAGRFPDAPDVETFWANLLAGRTSFREVPADRWDWRAVHDERRNVNGRSYSRWIAPLDDIRGFDPGYFAMTAHEAACTDPQQRLFAMEAIRALDDAGIEVESLRGAACSVHVGATLGDYHRLLERAGESNAFAMTGNSPSLIPARLSYHLDLKGASVAVDTACSSSLVAVHEACRGLMAGDAELAVAGGVYLMTTPMGQVLSAGANILSPRGVCTPFDADADGIVIGEAVAAVVLKPLAAALADGDPVRAVIRASEVNQDGRTNGITAPSAASQAALVGRVLERADADGSSVGYVETHGTGTRLGDPIELDGLRRALGEGDRAVCHLGSLKANIGHAYHAAGIAGLIKAALCVERGLIPPQPGVAALNPLLRLDGSPFRIARRATVFETAAGEPRRAGVSSFGFSGTNAHVLVEGREGEPAPVRARVQVAFDLRDCWVDAPAEAPVAPPLVQPEAAPAAARACAPGPGAPADRRQAVLAELADYAGCAPEAIAADASLEADLGLDSIKLMSLLSRYGGGARAADDGQVLAGLRTVAELLAMLDAEGAEPDAAAPEAMRRSALLADIAAASGRDDGAALAEDALLEADLGIDSIKLMGVLSRYGGGTEAGSAGADLAALRTVGDLLALLGGKQAAPECAAGSEGPPAGPGPADAPEREISLLPAQRLFLLGHHLIDSSSLCSWVELRGPLDVGALRRAWQHVVDGAPGLRVVFRAPPDAARLGEIRAFLLAGATVPEIAVEDLSTLDEPAREAALQVRFEEGLNRCWSVDRWPLHEISLCRLAPDRHVLFVTDEHVAVDGIGNQRLLAALLAAYAAIVEGRALPAGESDAVFVAALERLAAHGDGVAAEAPGGTPYQWDVAERRIEDWTPRFAVAVEEATRERTRALADAAAALGGTVSAVLSLALARAAVRTGATSGPVSIQVPTSGRVADDVDAGESIGCFAQNMPVEVPEAHLSAPWNEALPGFAGQVRAFLEAEADWSMAVALARVIEADVPLVDGSVPAALRPVFRARLRSNLYSPFIGETGLPVRAGGLEVCRYRAGTVNGTATVDVLHEIFDGRLHSAWNWDAAHFAARDIDGLRAAFEAEIDACLAAAPGGDGAPDGGGSGANPVVLPPALSDALAAVLGRLPPDCTRDTALEASLGLDSLKRVRIVSKLPAACRADPGLRRRLLAATTMGALADAFDAPGRAGVSVDEARAGATPVIARILARMRAAPDALAVRGPDGTFTYGELDDVTACLASGLAARGARSGERVGLLFGRGRWFVAAALAVMRAGAAYVPLDPDYPEERSRYILDHAGPRVVLTVRALASQARRWTGGIEPEPSLLVVDDTDRVAPEPADPGAADGTALPDADDTMVVLYTSGSTGRPKGVELTHRGYANRLEWHHAQFALTPGECVLQKTSVCFDVSIWELFWPLMYGGTVHAVDGPDARDPWSLAEAMRAHRVAVVHFVPSMFAEFLTAMEADPGPNAFPDLRWVVLSGEGLPPALVRRWFRLFGDGAAPLANLYGPTEASIDVTCEVIRETPPADAVRVPIGAAIDNVALHVLDEDLRPVSEGETGELAIGGVQLARGYFRAPALTAAAFVDVALPEGTMSRLYRTGDLVRRLADGRYDFLGRRDSQVKLRGYRIELDEIEAVLREAEGVGEATVLIEGEGPEARLVAWVAPDTGPDAATLRARCVARLPEWMVPSRIELRAGLPKTANGKLDRAALAVNAGSAEDAAAPLAPAQRWMVRHFPPPHAWWGYTRFTCERRLDPGVVEATFRQLARRHEALRTVYRRDPSGDWHQHVLPADTAEGVSVTVRDVEGMSEAAVERLVGESLHACCDAFVLDRMPLNHALVLRHGPARWEFCLANHHITGDFVSAAVLFREFWQIHDALARTGAAPALPPAPPGPAALARHLARLDESGALEAERRHWHETARAASGFVFAADRPEAENREADGESVEVALDAGRTRALREGCRGHLGLTLYPVLAAPLYATLAELAGCDTAVVSHRTTGRVLGSDAPDFAESVGNFAIHYPVALTVSDADPAGLCRALASALAAVPRGGASYDWLGPSLGETTYPDERLTPVRLNYLGVLPDEVQGDFRFPRDHHNRRLAPADQRRSADIEIHLAVRDDRLVIAASWSAARWERSRVEALTTRYRDALVALSDSLDGEGGEP